MVPRNSIVLLNALQMNCTMGFGMPHHVLYGFQYDHTRCHTIMYRWVLVWSTTCHVKLLGAQNTRRVLSCYILVLAKRLRNSEHPFFFFSSKGCIVEVEACIMRGNNSIQNPRCTQTRLPGVYPPVFSHRLVLPRDSSAVEGLSMKSSGST